MLTILESVELDEGLKHTPVCKESPLAPVRLIEKRMYLEWEVVRCPYCEGTHRHSGMPKGYADPRQYLGGRMAHCHPDMHVTYAVSHATPCWNGDAEYRLVAIEGAPTKKELDQHFPTVLGTPFASLHISNWTEGIEHSERYQEYMAEHGQPATRQGLSAEIRDAVWELSGGRCWYCGVTLRPFSTFTIDHVLPVIDGGTNELTNLVPCCKTCNSIKGDRPREYLRSRLGVRQFWHERRDGAR